MTFSVNNTAEHTPLSVFYKGAKPTQQRLGYLYRYIYLKNLLKVLHTYMLKIDK